MSHNFLLIHGAWHGAANWVETAECLAQAGHHVSTIDLPGHGPEAKRFEGYPTSDPSVLASAPSASAGISIDEAAEAVIRAIEQGPTRPIVVAHSLGGPVASAAAERVPDAIGRLVYLAAFVPMEGRSAAEYAALAEGATGYGQNLFVADPAVVGAIRINPSGDESYMAQLREAYYHDVPHDVFVSHAARLVPDLPPAFWIAGVNATAQAWGRVPRSYVRCTEDRALAPALQSRMIAEADAMTPGNVFRVLELQSSHSPFASMPKRLAAALVDAT